MSTEATETPKAKSARITKAEVTEQAKLVFTLNKEMNAAKKRYDESRAALLTMMDATKTTELSPIKGDGNMLKAVVSTPVDEYIDVKELRKLVTDEVFLACVSATKGATAKNAGADVVAKATRTKDGTRNVTVSVIK
jgi:hypothetical protein